MNSNIHSCLFVTFSIRIIEFTFVPLSKSRYGENTLHIEMPIKIGSEVFNVGVVGSTNYRPLSPLPSTAICAAPSPLLPSAEALAFDFIC